MVGDVWGRVPVLRTGTTKERYRSVPTVARCCLL